MSSLKAILERVEGKYLKAGGSISDELEKSLAPLKTRLYRTFLILFVTVIGATVYAAFLLAMNVHQASQARLLASAMGLSVGGGIEVLRRVWRDWVRTELLLTLIPGASEAQVRAIVDKLRKEL